MYGDFNPLPLAYSLCSCENVVNVEPPLIFPLLSTFKDTMIFKVLTMKATFYLEFYFYPKNLYLNFLHLM
jgi:hypothetical protein